MRTVAVATVGRSDYGLYRPVLRALTAAAGIRLQVIVGGMHLSPTFGLTVREIENDGFAIAARVEMLSDSDAPEAISASIGRGVIGFADAFSRLRPDLLIVLGDRFEMYAAAVAALPLKIPVAHIHGGEVTQGAIDDALRHSMTKLSHLHFVATEEYARRVAQLGEETWRITISGAPGLDNLRTTPLIDADTLSQFCGLAMREPFLLATFHPVTLEFEETEWHVRELLAALDALDMPVLFTQPNADTGGGVARRLIEDFVRHRPSARLIDNLGTARYFSVMSLAAAMIGNSSSGLIEAPSFALPVVNIGTRQAGRIRARNVVDVGYSRTEILDGLRRALDEEFRESLRGMVNPYGSGDAAKRIVERLTSVTLDRRLLEKRFRDEPQSVAQGLPVSS